MKILGISAFYHDSAAAFLEDGHILAAAQEERFSRIKHDAGFPTHAVDYVLQEAGYDLSHVDAIVFYDKPFLKLERLLESYLSYAPRGIRSFIMAMPVWLKEKMFLKRMIRQSLEDMGFEGVKNIPLLFPEHHLSHAASAFYPSPFEEAAILTIDGVGEWATATSSKGNGRSISLIKELNFPHSLGLLYSAFTYFLGFKVNSGEYKLMGLAPYGISGSERVNTYKQIIYDRLITLNEDGSIWLNQSYFSYTTGLRMVPDKKWESLFGMPRRTDEGDLSPEQADLALAIQQVTEEIVLKMAQHAKDITGANKLCMAGGVALNCVANGLLHRSGIFDELYIQPAAGDAGGALGAALAAHHIYFEQERRVEGDQMKGSYLGPSYGAHEIKRALKPFQAVTHQYQRPELYEVVAQHLEQGMVVGWFQGRMEFGPRALGARSILGDPRRSDMQKKLNLKIKYRESFRPFAPSVLPEDAKEYFGLNHPSPYMLLVYPVQEHHRNEVPEDFVQMSLRDKLAVERSDVPAITHIDFSARVQTVHAEFNADYAALLEAFKAKTGVGMLINTSFNVRGEPIVCTPSDAYACFMDTEMDVLVLDDYVLLKSEQPTWTQKRIFDKD
ncbi:MAG: carbamoyltransferase [Bacteroidota bacterium]